MKRGRKEGSSNDGYASEDARLQPSSTRYSDPKEDSSFVRPPKWRRTVPGCRSCISAASGDEMQKPRFKSGDQLLKTASRAFRLREYLD